MNNGIPFVIEQTNEVEKWRWETFWDKEPETIAWLESIPNGHVLYDIGANIGIYSLYFGAINPEGICYAFEPGIDNFMALGRNVVLNKFDNVMPIPVGVSNKSGMTDFFEPDVRAGATGGQLGKPIDGARRTQTPIISLDQMDGLNIPKPKHIKIDIDGLEIDVLQGGSLLFTSGYVKSVLVEIDQRGWNDYFVRSFMASCGYTTENKFNSMAVHSDIRRRQEGIKAKNVVFTR